MKLHNWSVTAWELLQARGDDGKAGILEVLLIVLGIILLFAFIGSHRHDPTKPRRSTSSLQPSTRRPSLPAPWSRSSSESWSACCCTESSGGRRAATEPQRRRIPEGTFGQEARPSRARPRPDGAPAAAGKEHGCHAGTETRRPRPRSPPGAATPASACPRSHSCHAHRAPADRRLPPRAN